MNAEEVVAVPFSAEELAPIQRLAEAMGTPLGELIRHFAILGYEAEMQRAK